MNDPKRLVEEHRDPALVRALNAGVELAPPPAAEAAVWAAVNAALAAGAGASVAVTGVAPKGLGAFGKGLLGKWWLSVLGVAVVGAVGYLAFRGPGDETSAVPARIGASERPVEKAPSTPAAEPANEIPRVTLDELAREARPARESSGRPAPSAGEAVPERSVELGGPAAASEGELVLGARKAVRAGRVTEALDLIARARRDFPGGSLAQERDALEIEALSRNGAHESARTRARAFLLRYPGSPYAKNFEALFSR